MPAKSLQADDPERSRKFIEAARKLGCDASEERCFATLEEVSSAPPASGAAERRAGGEALNVQYRPLIEADIAAISRVHRRACLIAYRFIDWSYSERAVRDWYAGKFSEWDWGLVADDNGVVGFIAASGTHIDQLFVDPDRQATGIGTALLEAALARMPPRVTLHVFEANAPARRFYERHGFREIGRLPSRQGGAVELVYCRDASLHAT